jgi:hypothetical protein
VLVALLIGLYGIREGTLPRQPSAAAIDTAILLRVLGYLAFCVAYQYGASPVPAGGAGRGPRPALTTAVLVAFLGLGLLGQCLAYESLEGFLDFVSSPVQHRERAELPTTPAGAASTFLRPFLGFALVLLWSRWLRRGGRPRPVAACAAATAGLIVLLLLANFSYNRGSLLAPVLAVTAAYSVHVRRVSFLAIALGGTVVLFAALAFGWYRSTNLEISELATADLSGTWSDDQVAEFFQIYASGPQMTAYLIDEHGDSPLYLGRTLVCSLLYPVPVLGKAFREGSGVCILNMLIYQDPDVVDQVIPYDAELYINFHAAGVVLGYGVLGWLVRGFQARFLQARHAVESYAWLLLALWLIFPGSLPVASQMYVYFFWPVYCYFGLHLVARLWSRLRGAGLGSVPRLQRSLPS